MDEKQFKDNIHEWDKTREDIKTYRAGLAKLTIKEKSLKEASIIYMENHQIDGCNLDTGQVSLRRTVRNVVDVKRSNLPEILTDYYKSAEHLSEHDTTVKIHDIMKFIEANYSKSTESMSLTKTNPK